MIERKSTETLTINVDLDFDLGNVLEELWNEMHEVGDMGREYRGFKLVTMEKSVSGGSLVFHFERNS